MLAGVLEYGERHPAILPRKDHISELIVRHYHERVYHQGRSITRGAVRQAGYWIVEGHHAVLKESHATPNQRTDSSNTGGRFESDQDHKKMSSKNVVILRRGV